MYCYVNNNRHVHKGQRLAAEALLDSLLMASSEDSPPDII